MLGAEAVSGAAPCQERIIAGGHFHLHVIPGSSEGGAGLGLLPHQGTLLVEGVEAHRCYLIGESIGPFHVMVVFEMDEVVVGAVALVVIYDVVAGAHAD